MLKVDLAAKPYALGISCMIEAPLIKMKVAQIARSKVMFGLISFVLLVVYIGGAWKFWTGFGQTQYSQSRPLLTLFWPVMLLNGSYRQNFRRALKG
jgi:hypothetical protein